MAEINSTEMTIRGIDAKASVYGIFGVCRSGTTAIEKLLTLADVVAYHQPIKSSLLRGVTDIDLGRHAKKTPAHGQPVAIKETLGAYSNATSILNPLNIMLKSISADRLHNVFTIKEPFGNFLSWLRMAEIAPPKSRAPLTTEELLGNYILSSQTLCGMFDQSRELGIDTTVFDYESLKDQDADTVTRELLTNLHIDPSVYTPASWSSRDSVRSSNSGIVYVAAPGKNDLHKRLDASDSFRYFAPDQRLLAPEMHSGVKNTLHQAGLYDNYDRMLQYAHA